MTADPEKSASRSNRCDLFAQLKCVDCNVAEAKPQHGESDHDSERIQGIKKGPKALSR